MTTQPLGAVGDAVGGAARKIGHLADDAATAVGDAAQKATEVLHARHNKPEYTKFDYQREKNLYNDDVALMHTVTINKQESILPNDMAGIELMIENNSVIVKNVVPQSPFYGGDLMIGCTIFVINGNFDFKSVDEAEKIIKETETLLTVICGNVKNGKLQPQTDVWPPIPEHLKPKHEQEAKS